MCLQELDLGSEEGRTVRISGRGEGKGRRGGGCANRNSPRPCWVQGSRGVYAWKSGDEMIGI